MDPNKLTQKSQQTLAAAIETAREAQNPALEDLHILHAMVTQDGIAQEIISTTNQLDAVTTATSDALSKLPSLSDGGDPQISATARAILNQATKEAKQRQDEYVAQEILLLALTKTTGPAQKILSHHGISTKLVEREIDSVRQGSTTQNPTSDSQYKALEKYTTDLTALAKEAKLDPVIGRDTEIRRLMQVLSRRTKNNPVLIGEPGVGKTAIVEGLAQRIIHGDVPQSLKDKKVLVLEMASVLAGARYRGEFEERLKVIIDEVQKQAGQIILFVDELHTVVGAGGAEGAVDAGNMLKPGLARGTLRLIGATTISEYRKYIEKDAALERRFQPIVVQAPSIEDTISILRGLKEKYEVHHGIRIQDEAIVAAATLSERYITDRHLPDKAIDALDEAASALKIETESQPADLDNLNRQITRKEIELKALKKEKDKSSRQRATELQKEVSDLKEKQQLIQRRWDDQQKIVSTIRQLREQLETLNQQAESAERDIDLDKAAKIKYGDIPELKKKITQAEQEWATIPDEQKLLKEEVTADDIAAVISRWSGVPVSKLLQSEAKKLTNLEADLAKQVIGQSDALQAVANAIRRSRAGISEETRPIASFLFLGPTGVGKTETAKAVAQLLFQDERALVRLDMSEYAERHSIARLIGAPPGYVGYEEGGQLTEAVRRKPYTVVLFDEIEKAHPQIYNTLLQIFDEGRLTDGQGKTINFKNTILIMTSNIGAKDIQQSRGSITETVKQEVMQQVESTFPPEFLNRLDHIILFESLTPEQLKQIVGLQIAKAQERLQAKDINLVITPEVSQYLAKNGYDPTYGARPLKRLIQTEILDPLALKVLEEDLSHRTLTATLKQNKVVLQTSPKTK